MSKFRVLQITSLSGIAGTELSTLMLAKELRRRGHYVGIFCNDGPLAQEFERQGIQVILGKAYVRKMFLWEAVKTVCDLRKCIAKNRIDILHVQTGSCVPLVFLANRLNERKAKIIWHCRGLGPKNYSIAVKLFNFTTDFIISNCNSEKSKITEHGVPEHKIRTIYNPPPAIEIPLERPPKDEGMIKELKIKDTEAVIGCISRLDGDRGVQYYLEAASRLVNKYKYVNIKFLVVGDGPLRGHLVKKARMFGISDYVMFLGVRRDIGRVYTIIDLLVNPNLFGLGTDNVNAEAMAFGKPIVATEIGGIPEIITDGENGFLVPPRNPEAIAEKVLKLLKDEGLRKRMGEAGRKRVEKYFTAKKLGDEVEKVYESLVDRSV